MAKQTFTTGQVLTAAQMTSLQETAMGGGPATAKTTSYVLVAADAGKTVAMNAAGATTITVNTGLFSAGDTVFIQNLGAGACTVTAGTATVATAGSLILPQNDAGILYFTSASAAIFYDYVQPGITSPVTTKGDLYTFSTTDDRLAVGNNGDTLVADSSATTGLRWQADFAAGKNKIINGDFYVNQRNFSSTSTDGFLFDRHQLVTSTGGSASAQTFTAGTAPVSGYNGKGFVRFVTTGQTANDAYTLLKHCIEDVRTLAGQTVTFSFWAKSASGTPKISLEVIQDFGTGGSPSAAVFTYAGQSTISTSWTRYSITFTMPSLSGKTIGTTANTSLTAIQLWVSAGTDFNARTGSLGIQTNTFDIWGVQLEAGSVATAFQTATGTIQGELAACQRYYYRQTATTNQTLAIGSLPTTSIAVAFSTMPVTMRTAPTFAATAGNTFNAVYGANTTTAASSITADVPSISTSSWYITMASGVFTTGGAARITAVSGSTYLEFSAEL
jgi:hypothetical protein